jgi:hypothetical protein
VNKEILAAGLIAGLAASGAIWFQDRNLHQEPKIVTVRVPVEVEKRVEVPVEKRVEVPVEKRVEVPYIVQVPVPVPSKPKIIVVPAPAPKPQLEGPATVYHPSVCMPWGLEIDQETGATVGRCRR